MNDYNRVLFTNKDNKNEIKRALDTFFNFIIDDTLNYLNNLIKLATRSEILTTLNNIVIDKYVSQREDILPDFLNNDNNITLLIDNVTKTINEKINTNMIIKRNMDLVYKIIAITNNTNKLNSINMIITKYYNDKSNQNLLDSTRLLFNNNLEMLILSKIKDYSVDSISIQNKIIDMIRTNLQSIKVDKDKITTTEKFIEQYNNMEFVSDIKTVIKKHSTIIEKFSINTIINSKLLLILIIIGILIFVSLMVSNGITMKCLADKCTTNENISRIFLSSSALFFIIFLIKNR